MSTPSDISVSAKITLKIGKQSIELSQADAKRLLAQLQELVGEKPAKVEWHDRIVEKHVPHIPFPPAICEKLPYPCQLPRQPQSWEVTCLALP